MPRLTVLPLATLWLAVLPLAGVALGAAPAQAQHDMHAGHAMTTAGGWRMVPMDPNMPMLPGLADAVPVVGPFMPGMGMDPAMLPEARPSELVALGDRDTLAISVSMVGVGGYCGYCGVSGGGTSPQGESRRPGAADCR